MKIQSKQKVKHDLKVKLMLFALSFVFVLSASFFLIDLVSIKNETVAKSINAGKKQISFTEKELNENKTFIDTRPLISFDGKTLFFGRRNFEKNIGGISDFQDIWYSTLDENGNWNNTSSLGSFINNDKANGICSISPDGKEIIITNEYSSNKLAPIAKAVNIDGHWSAPEPLVIEEYSNKNQYEDFYLSYLNNMLFMAVERKEGLGDQDIYFSLSNGTNSWKKPINLGKQVNTSSSDFAPFLASDGKTLFFSSDREGGLGNSDIYVTKRLDDTWTNWSTPKNLGPTVNSAEDESYFSVSADFETIFVESLTKKTGERKIFEVKLPSEFKPEDVEKINNLFVKNIPEN